MSQTLKITHFWRENSKNNNTISGSKVYTALIVQLFLKSNLFFYTPDPDTYFWPQYSYLTFTFNLTYFKGHNWGFVNQVLCSNHDPRGYDGATIVDQSFTYDYIGKIFKNLLENHWPGKLKFIWKLPDIVEIQVCTNHDPRGMMGPQ